MRRLTNNSTSREAAKHRRVEIEERLAEYGLFGDSRGASSGPLDDRSHFRRLSAALVSLGPIFSSFGVYLSFRVDLFGARGCLELAEIPDRADPSPTDAVFDLLEQELGCEPTTVFSSFDEEPFESRLLFQSHGARLRSGEAVTVKLARPEFEQQLASDVAHLRLLSKVFVGEAWSDIPIEETIADFRRSVDLQLDLARQARLVQESSRDIAESHWLRVSSVHPELCSSGVLISERLTGRTLEEVTSPLSRTDGRGAFQDSLDPDALGSRLCLIWLTLALQGRVFPVDPRPEDIRVLSNGQIAFTGGRFASLASDVKHNLLEYLVAASSHDPDRACGSLIKEMTRSGHAAGEDEFRHRLRQLVPLRDGGWSDGVNSDTFAEHLFLQWQVASKLGYRPRSHLIDFIRGLFSITSTVRRVSRGRDHLAEALEDLRLSAAMNQFKEMMSLGELTEGADKYSTMMMELPRRLDEALSLLSDGTARLKVDTSGPPEGWRDKRSSAAVIALLLTLASIVLLAHHLSASGFSSQWLGRVSAISFVLTGALLLRAAGWRR